MRIATPLFVLSLLVLTNAFVMQSDAIAQKQCVEEKKMNIQNIQGNDMPGMGSMRIEDPDGTMRPLPQSSMPESRMSTEDLQEVPGVGGGTMVNVEGRFQSILQVPEGSDNAIHKHDSADHQKTKP